MRYNGNLAYDWEFYENTARVQKKVTEHKQQTKAKAKAKAAKLHRTVSICAIMLALCAGFMISRNVAVYESRNEVEALQKELNQLKEYSSQKAFELDQSLDLELIEETAKKKLGMTRPEKYQIVYVNIKQDDVTEVTAKEVEGIKGAISILAKE
ncbi:MAG: septum formation initiator family protein [Clostridia bacterium]|nr:septum formation initiator family protein [Clostridia bacterium]